MAARREALFIRPATSTKCDVCEWPNEGLAARVVLEMRRRHHAGGLNVCRDCIVRARASLPPRPE